MSYRALAAAVSLALASALMAVLIVLTWLSGAWAVPGLLLVAIILGLWALCRRTGVQ